VPRGAIFACVPPVTTELSGSGPGLLLVETFAAVVSESLNTGSLVFPAGADRSETVTAYVSLEAPAKYVAVAIEDPEVTVSPVC
jgi:hypothetical protein